MSIDNRHYFLPACVWGAFVASFMILLYFEKMVFDRHLGEEIQYGILAFVLLGVGLLASLSSKWLSSKVLVAIIFSGILAGTVIWFLIFYNLPVMPSRSGCDAIVCQAFGQVILLVLHVSILPVLLIEWTRRLMAGDTAKNVQSASKARTPVVPVLALVVAGGVSIAAGLVSAVAYYWPVFVAFVSLLAMACAFMVIFWKNALPEAPDARGKPDTNLFFRDLIVVLLVGVPGFAMMDREAYKFSLLVTLGACMVMFSVIYMMMVKFTDVARSLFLAEVVIFGVLALISTTMYYLYNRGMTVNLLVGIPEFVTGFCAGYIWTRIIHVAQGISYPKAFPVPARTDNMRNFSSKFSTSILLLLFAGSTAFNIDPTAADTVSLVYPVGIVLASIGLILWTVSALKLRECKKSP
nr:hypothetical protein [Candidatus Sigynarchaeota archaeon]